MWYLNPMMYTDNGHNIANRQCCAVALTRCWRKVSKSVPFLWSSTSLTWDAIPSLEAEEAWAPLRLWGWLTQPGTVPFVEPYWNVYCLLHSGWDQGCVWHQGLKHLQASLSKPSPCMMLGFQLKARSWQCSLLAAKHPQQCAVDPEGMSLDWVFVWCFRGKKSWDSSPFLFAQAPSTLIHCPGNQLSLRLWLLGNQMEAWIVLSSCRWFQ